MCATLHNAKECKPNCEDPQQSYHNMTYSVKTTGAREHCYSSLFGVPALHVILPLLAPPVGYCSCPDICCKRPSRVSTEGGESRNNHTVEMYTISRLVQVKFDLVNSNKENACNREQQPGWLVCLYMPFDH